MSVTDMRSRMHHASFKIQANTNLFPQNEEQIRLPLMEAGVVFLILSAAETLLKADEFYTANESAFTGGNNIIQQQWKTAQLSVKSK